MSLCLVHAPNAWPQAEERQFLVIGAENAISARIASKVRRT